jgi:hypothetical protein
MKRFMIMKKSVVPYVILQFTNVAILIATSADAEAAKVNSAV